ncbi:transposase [Ochrobactrum sp. C6C9]|uniref:integrase core domain-containing protein n=1 Tax=Ochrobactrum sp. C6C9 TaxID=2736662 RepID=UPI00353017BA|nr:transposase [Ochrobactrum sp. C6C9]
MALHHAGRVYANGDVEIFQRPHSRGVLNQGLFLGLDPARSTIADWAEDYNTFRPHSSLECQTLAA